MRRARLEEGRATGQGFVEDQGVRGVVIYRGEDGFWVAECPSLPGCVSQGRTKPEAIDNIREAIEGWIETAQSEGLPVPEDNLDVQVIAV